MHRFTDAEGRVWTIGVNVTTLKKVRGALDVNLLDIADKSKDLLERLQTDPILLADCLWVLCEDQAKARNPAVTDEDFGRALAGDAIEQATAALLDELMDFFPRADQREAGRLALAKLRTAQTRLIELGRKQIEALDPDAIADRAAAETLSTPGPLSGNSPGSPE